MSLILDALRKSEAERRRGETPSLYSGLPTPSTQRRPAAMRYLPWIVAAVLVAVALFAFRKDDAPATKDELAQSAPADEAPAPAIVEPVTTPPVVAAPAAPPTAAPAPPGANVDALVKPVAATPIAAEPMPPAPAPAAPLPPSTPPIASAAAPSAEPNDALPPLSVLDPGTRNALPPLKLSMHFYNSDPERRFAIVDGKRVTEGTQLGAAVVTEIRRDGVVLDVNGQRVLLPRP